LSRSYTEDFRQSNRVMNNEFEQRNVLPKVELNINLNFRPDLFNLPVNRRHEANYYNRSNNGCFGQGGSSYYGQDRFSSYGQDRFKNYTMDRYGSYSQDSYRPRKEESDSFSNFIGDRPTRYDTRQDAEIKKLREELVRERQGNQPSEKPQLKERVEAGVIKDAHYTVKAGETLNSLARLALHRAGNDHMTPAAIKFEEEKIRTLNHLAPHQTLHAGLSIMLRTPQEVAAETTRRMKGGHKSLTAREEGKGPFVGVRGEVESYSPIPRPERIDNNLPKPAPRPVRPGY